MTWGLYLTNSEFREAIKGFENSVTAVADLAHACAAVLEADGSCASPASRARGGRAVARHLIEEAERLEQHYRSICRRTEERAT